MVLFPEIFGPTGTLSSFLLEPQNALYILAFLIPLILLYLIRPKPVNVAVPSLMFILNDMGKSNVHRFFRTIFRDILFLIQALAILLLALSLAKPFINVDQESLVRQSILIIDTSASTRAFDGDRFEEIREKALASLTRENVVIIARKSPYILDENGDVRLSAGQAESFISDLEATDMDGDLPTALDLATTQVGPDSKVTIISDFVLSNLESEELIEAKLKVLRSKGAIVEVVPIASKGRNIGIIDAALNSQNATVDLKIQNFNPEPAEIGLEYNGDSIILPNNILAPDGRPGSLMVVSVPIAHGISELVLTPSDDFETDNHYFVSVHERDRLNILMITNDNAAQNSKLIPALTAAGDQFTKINVEYGQPPKVPDLQHQVYIIKDVNPEFILPGINRDLKERIEEGAILVVLAQPDLFRVNLGELLPVAPKDLDPLGGKQEILVNGSLGLMRGLSYIGQVNGDQLLRVRKTEDAVVHAYVMTNDGPEPVLAHKRIGKGAVIYYGIRDQKAVDLDPQSYAVVWGRIIDYSIPDSRLLNMPTGAMLTSPTKNILTPSGRKASPLIAAEAGIYQAGETAIAANLYGLQTSKAATDAVNVRYESAISTSAEIGSEDTTSAATGEEAKVPKDLSNYLILLGIGAMILELLYVKFRGDI